MAKLFIGEWKNILKIVISVILCAMIFSTVEIFLFKGRLIVFSVILTSGCSMTLVHFYFQQYKSKVISKLTKGLNTDDDIELLKKIKFYDISKMDGTFGLIVDGFDVKGKTAKCRLMHCLEIIPIFSIAIQAILAATLGKSASPFWALEIFFFFILLNININLSYIYKNSLSVSKEINKQANNFENHFLLHKLMFYSYIVIEVIIVTLGFVGTFVSSLDRYRWLILIAFAFSITGILFGTYARIKKSGNK